MTKSIKHDRGGFRRGRAGGGFKKLLGLTASSFIAPLVVIASCQCETPATTTHSGGRDGSRPATRPTDRPRDRPPRTAQAEATVISVHGEVTLDTRNRRAVTLPAGPGGTGTEPPAAAPGARRTARQEDELHIGDLIVTAAGADASVRTSDGGEIHIGPRAIVVIEPYGPGQVLIARGRVRIYLPASGPRRRPVNVVTAAGIATVATGDLMVATRDDGAVRFESLAGTVPIDLAVGDTAEPAVLARTPFSLEAGKRVTIAEPRGDGPRTAPAAEDGSHTVEQAIATQDRWIAEAPAAAEDAAATAAASRVERATGDATALFAQIERRRERTVQLHEQHRRAGASKRGEQSSVQQQIIENARALYTLNHLGRAAWGRVRTALVLLAELAPDGHDAGGPGSPLADLSGRAAQMFRRTPRIANRFGGRQPPLQLDPRKLRPQGRVPLTDMNEARGGSPTQGPAKAPP